MMQIYKLDGNNIDIVSCPPQDVRKGDYLMIEDSNADRGLIVQVVNISYANVPGILEDILRGTSTEEIRGNDIDVLRLTSFMDMIKDAKILNCKIRRALVRGKLNYDLSWTPSRSTSRIIKLSDQELLKIANIYRNPAIIFGTSKGGATVSAGISAIDGTLNIVTGKKGSGKSHLSKLLVLSLISHGGICVIFDINGEYTNLGYTENGNESDFHDKILDLCPGNNFKVTLNYAGLGVLLDIVSTVLNLPTTSTWEIRRIWRTLGKNGYISFKKLGEAIYSIPNNYVRDAILRRYESLRSTNLFTDNTKEAVTIEKCVSKLKNGGALVFNLREMPSSFRSIIVEFVLSKLCRLLEKRVMNAVFLIAEEAHLYIKETYWEDIVTRMRHLGMFATFITNQPDSIDESVYRQADNIFLFNFTNENDLNTVSKATMIDVETINIIAKELPPHHCLILGKVVNDFPIISKVNRLKVKTMGHTRFFFTELHKS
ncbi:MAG: ATP-binding protein [Candidatus Bathyarchaeota archaeon]|nr:MAG: ATP-binding protein [Candidatus Bathyarchaeota archaeon]